jgi:hypothetical protein
VPYTTVAFKNQTVHLKLDDSKRQDVRAWLEQQAAA